MSTRQKHAHCSYCGQPFADAAPWPRTCAPCGNVTYRNPLPVAVTLVPVDGGLLCIRRTIEPARGKLALPGGFLEVGESWQEGCARELREETGVEISATEVTLFRLYSSSREGLLLLFGLGPKRRADQLSAFTANEETEEMLVIHEPIELAFPLHTKVVREYFEQQKH
jgi:ADP-ribose pyrophosphatase YjhB (NUDIX family)